MYLGLKDFFSTKTSDKLRFRKVAFKLKTIDQNAEFMVSESLTASRDQDKGVLQNVIYCKAKVTFVQKRRLRKDLKILIGNEFLFSGPSNHF